MSSIVTCSMAALLLCVIVIVNGHADSERASAHYHLCSPPADVPTGSNQIKNTTTIMTGVRTSSPTTVARVLTRQYTLIWPK